MTPSRRRLVAVIGASSPSREEYERGLAVGREIARSGATLLCGGLGGVMEAACRGAKEAGGLTVGILPGAAPDAANAWVDVPIATGLGEARNAVIAAAGDAFVAIGGGLGTLSEIALALRRGAPVVGLGTFEVEGVVRAGSAEEAVAAALARR